MTKKELKQLIKECIKDTLIEESERELTKKPRKEHVPLSLAHYVADEFVRSDIGSDYSNSGGNQKPRGENWYNRKIAFYMEDAYREILKHAKSNSNYTKLVFIIKPSIIHKDKKHDDTALLRTHIANELGFTNDSYYAYEGEAVQVKRDGNFIKIIINSHAPIRIRENI